MLENSWYKKENPFIGLTGMGGGVGSNLVGGGDLSWFRANIRGDNAGSSTYFDYVDPPHIHTAYDSDHIYFVYTIQAKYNGSNSSFTHRGEIWKVKKKDGTTVWHKSYENVDGHYEIFEIYGCDISPNGSYLVISGIFSKEGVGYGNYDDFRYGFVELKTSDGTIRTTSEGALYAGGVQDDNTNNGLTRYGGILYAPNSNTDFLLPGIYSSPAYGGFARVDKGASAYTTEYHVDTYESEIYDSWPGGNNHVRSLKHDPDNSDLMWLHQQDIYNSDYYNYFLLYDVTGSTPSYVCGIRLRAAAFDGRALFTTKYHASNNIDLYIYVAVGSNSRLTKFTWNGSSWSAAWQNTVTVSNGGYGARCPLVLTWDDDNNRLVVMECDPPRSYTIRQINPSTGANITTRRIAIDGGTSTRTDWDLDTTNTNGDKLANITVYNNPCNRAIDGYFYASLSGIDNNPLNFDYLGHLAFKLPTDISKLPSSVTSYGVSTGSGPNDSIAMSIGISDDDPNASYSTSSIDGTYDTIASHTPTLYGATSGPNNYYNWNESTYDEWLTASTAQWPSDTQLDLQIS